MESILMQDAAVAAIVACAPKPEILLLKRIANPQDPWSGHYAFPGGRRDRDDPSLLATCLRETWEECGIRLPTDSLVKEYPARQVGNHLHRPVPVTSYLFELPTQPVVSLQTTEIKSHQWLSLAYLSDASNTIQRPMILQYPALLFPCIPATDGFIWGFTLEILMLIIADHYPRLC